MSAEAAANLPDSRYIRGRATTPSSGRATTPTEPTFAMKPAEVLFDRRLTHRDQHVYDVMVYFRSGSRVEVGERWLAGGAGIDRRSLRAVVKRLVEFGLLERTTDRQKRAKYVLTAPIFGVPQFTDAGVTVSFAAPLVTCPTCGKRVGGLLKVGHCRSCNWKVRVRAEAEDVYDARMKAK